MKRLEDLKNVGKATLLDLELLGIQGYMWQKRPGKPRPCFFIGGGETHSELLIGGNLPQFLLNIGNGSLDHF